MYKDKEKQREANRESARRRRQGTTQGMTEEKGMTEASKLEGMTGPEGVTEGVTRKAKLERSKEGMTAREGMTPDIMLKLTDPFWRGRLKKICKSFEDSHHPEYKVDCWLGDVNLATACDWLECTR